jgi:hypothetical protein
MAEAADGTANNTGTQPGKAEGSDGTQQDATQGGQSEGNKQSAETKLDLTQEQLNALLARARREESKRFEKQLADAKLSEDERTKARIADLEGQLRERNALDRVLQTAAKVSPNPAAVAALVKGSLEYDKEGNVTNLKEAIETARTLAPELFPKRTGNADGGSRNEGVAGQSRVSQSMNDIIRQASGRLPSGGSQ